MKIGCIIQGRLGSSRLPGKILKEVLGRPLLSLLIERVRGSRHVEEVVVATTGHESDTPVAELAEREGVTVFRGSEEDVLDRTYGAAKAAALDVVVRITSDCPLIDPAIIDAVVEKYLEDPSCDYVSNVAPRTYPDGLDVELITFKELERAWRTYKDPYIREHVTNYVLSDPEVNKGCVVNSRDLKELRWTLDYPEDLAFIRAIYERLYPHKKLFHMQDILALLEAEPGIAALNARHKGGLDKMAVMKNRTVRSTELLKKAEKLIPTQTQTLSKGPTQFVRGVSPHYLQRGKGSHVWDVDGNEYIDYGMALGPITLGYCYPAVDEAIAAQLKDGITFTLMHPLEVEAAELITKVIPCAEMVRFAKNGSDVMSAAVRIARAFTGREEIAYCGYHGSQDWYVCTTERDAGVPKFNKELIHKFEYNDLDSLRKVLEARKGKVAAVTMEAVTVVEPKEGFLEGVKKLAHEHGALLVFDEIVTGGRFAIGGAQELFGVVPDLAAFGKGLANGMPVSFVCGRRDVMEGTENTFLSMTFGGEALSLAALVATIKEFRSKDVIRHVWTLGKQFKDGVDALIAQTGAPVQLLGYPCETMFQFTPKNPEHTLKAKSILVQETAKRGILLRGVQNISFSHTEDDIDKTLAAIKEAFLVMKKAEDEGDYDTYLEGIAIQPVFRKLM